MPGSARAFLSYTHIDDDFFGGAITALRTSLELGIKVVTGNRDFSIFQDKEGIELGQKWQHRLDEAVAAATFLIPVMTPSFFNSEACRDELAKFLLHEKDIGREDLVLPIYFVTSPQLERAEMRREDPLVDEISARQRFDWRDQADLPMNDPKIRSAIMKLAAAIHTAIDRVDARPVQEIANFEFAESTKSVSAARSYEKRNKKSNLLWVDDRPNNNIIERRSFQEYNVEIELALSTDEALQRLVHKTFDVIISDMGRPPDATAGYTLLEAVRRRGIETPFFIYAGSRAPAHTREALRRGAQGNTNRADELISFVLRSLGKIE